MRRSGIVFIILMSLVFTGRSQSMMPSYSINPVWAASKSDSNSIMLWGDYSLESSALQQSFLNKFVFGGHISESLKDKANSRLNDDNRIFYQSDIAASYFGWLDKGNVKQHAFYLQLRNQQMAFAQFPAQLFQLTFYGNASEKTNNGNFTDATAYLSNLNRVDVGFYHTHPATKNAWKLAANMGILQVANQWSLDWPSGNIATDPDGFSISLDNELRANISDTATSGAFAMDGWGLAADAWFNVDAAGLNWTFRVEDAGYLWMNDQALAINLDTAFTYSGRDISRIIDGEVSAVPSGDRDSLLQMAGATVDKQSFERSLPVKFSLVAQKQLNSWVITGGASYRVNAYRLPNVFARLGYLQSSLDMQYAATIGYGGAGGFKMGVQWQKTFADKLDLYLGLNHVNALVAPQTFSGFSAFGLIRYSL